MFDGFDVPKLIDFGSGRVIREKHIPTTLLMARTYYVPPEYEDPKFKYTDSTLLSVDIWEMAVLLYKMMDPPLTQGKIGSLQNADYSSLMKTPYSNELKLLLNDMCAIDPEKRHKVDFIISNPLFKEIALKEEQNFLKHVCSQFKDAQSCIESNPICISEKVKTLEKENQILLEKIDVSRKIICNSKKN